MDTKLASGFLSVRHILRPTLHRDDLAALATGEPRAICVPGDDLLVVVDERAITEAESL
jgi:hypothetical protein